MNDVKIEAVDAINYLRENATEWNWLDDDAPPIIKEQVASCITALQQRIAELTNANLRMLGERDRARIAEGEVAKLRDRARTVIEVFELLGNTRAVADQLTLHRRCELAMVALKETLALAGES